MSRQNTGNTCQSDRNTDYLGAIIDENGREIPISNNMIENSLHDLQDTPAEFICHLARRAAD
ncbi:PA1571 family protein [Zhongshania borealis]|uniref:Transposase n=1 Tax=Zhongshania borealis TaxID=889488 RepID=A0ABP7WBL4_9GAMM